MELSLEEIPGVFEYCEFIYFFIISQCLCSEYEVFDGLSDCSTETDKILFDRPRHPSKETTNYAGPKE